MANNFFSSQQAPKSLIANQSFVNRLTRMHGLQIANSRPINNVERKTGLKFVQVDLQNPQYRIQNALAGSFFKDQKLSGTLDHYFDAFLSEVSLGYEDIQERQVRLNDLYFMYTNDSFISRVTDLVANEATQLDVQDRLIGIESPDLNFVKKTYALLSQWGVTQQRIAGVCFDIQLYGEAFWSTKITEKGVEKITPLSPSVIKERLEFNPMKVAAFLAQRSAGNALTASKGEKIKKLVDLFKGMQKESPENSNDLFDTKLFGYELEDQMVVPPWEIVHFRYSADHSEFHPYGRPPMIGAIAPFKLTLATRTLQGLARTMSFPVKFFKVKTKAQMTNQMTFDHVRDVKEQYDNVPMDPLSATNEVYTFNTSIWFPEELLDVEINESKVDIDFVGDLEMYQDMVVVACGVPKGFLVQEWGGFGNSAISLVEQFKPFAVHVGSIQQTFLQELGVLIRMHYAITGTFDYNTPFVLSMRFPAEEMSEEKRASRTGSVELSQAVIDLITQAVGMEEGEVLPEDVIEDILAKYSFLDPTDIQKWLKKSRIQAELTKLQADADEEASGDGDGFGDEGGDEFGEGDGEELGDDFEGEDFGGGDELEESKKREERNRLREERLTEAQKKRLREKKKAKRIRMRETRMRELVRMQEVSKRYKEAKENLYFEFLKTQNIPEFTRDKRHYKLIESVTDGGNYGPYSLMFEALSSKESNGLLREGNSDTFTTLQEKMKELKESSSTSMDNQIQNLIQGGIENLQDE
ncbi:hypothetical protein FACS189444_1380 [Spirochaetia bacterium]|nr:hypothetical protein FACS189444_1380 [Spirochaetia bacterium]